jgi:hypothetical protein
MLLVSTIAGLVVLLVAARRFARHALPVRGSTGEFNGEE